MGLKSGWGLLFMILLMGAGGEKAAGEEIPTTLVFPTFLHTWGIRKATATHLFMLVGLKTRFNNPQGLAAVRLKSWEDPSTEDDDDELVVYGVNSGEHNVIWNTSMYGVGVYGNEGSGQGQFRNPRGIAADAQGNVWVADTGNHRIVHLYNPGKDLRWKGIIGSMGEGPGQFLAPSGVAVDSQGHLYVTDTGNSRVQVFNSEGQYLREIGADLLRPEGIAITDSGERWSYFRDTFLCVTDRDGRRLVKLSVQGELWGQIGDRKTDLERAHFGYVAIDYYGNIWVSDRENHCLHKFDHNFNYLVSFGKEGSGDREFTSPRGLAIWRRFGQVFIAERAGAQYYWVGVDLLDVTVGPSSRGGKFDIGFTLTERAYVTVEILDDGGRVLGALVAHRQESSGRYAYRWDGCRPGGEMLPGGRYTVRITAEPTYSSYHYFQKVVERGVRL